MPNIYPYKKVDNATPPGEQEPHADPEVETPLDNALELNTLDSTAKKPGVKNRFGDSEEEQMEQENLDVTMENDLTPPREEELHVADPVVEAPLEDALEPNTLDSITKKARVKRCLSRQEKVKKEVEKDSETRRGKKIKLK